MKHALLLSALSIGLLSSCTTAFKAGQTPDDVYYSPGSEVVSVKEDKRQKNEEAQYQEYISSLDDRYLRMKIANRYRWGALDNFDYWYDSRYDFNTYNNYYSNLSPYSSWNPEWNLSVGYGRYCPGTGGWGWNSPIYTVVHYTNPYYSGGSTSGSNISAYRNKNYNNTNYGYKDPKNGAFVPSASNSGFGNLLKRVFTGSENTSSYDRPARTFNDTRSNSNTSSPPPATSSNAGGNSGGFKSTGTSSSTGRGGKN
jgi:hypothetical protein